MKNKPERRAVGVLAAFARGKRDALAKRSMQGHYASREKQEAYDRGYRWARQHLHGQEVTA
jgi:hypothetical protein